MKKIMSFFLSLVPIAVHCAAPPLELAFHLILCAVLLVILAERIRALWSAGTECICLGLWEGLLAAWWEESLFGDLQLQGCLCHLSPVPAGRVLGKCMECMVLFSGERKHYLRGYCCGCRSHWCFHSLFPSLISPFHPVCGKRYKNRPGLSYHYAHTHLASEEGDEAREQETRSSPIHRNENHKRE